MLRHIQQATLILMAGNLLVNLLAFVKSLFIAAYYGTSAELDVYFLSLAPFNLISGVLLSSVQAAFIPRYLQLIQKNGKQYAYTVFVTFVICVILCVGIVNLGLFFGSSVIASYLGTGFTANQVSFTALLLKFSTLLLMFAVLSEIGRFFFNAHRQFTFSACIPLLSGFCSFGYLLLFHERGVSVLMHGLVLGMFIQSCVILYAVRRFGGGHITFFSLLHPEIRHIFSVMFPLLLGASFGQVNVVIDQIMASTLPAGSIAALNFAIKLHSMLTQMFIMVISRAVLPFFAQQVAEDNIEALKETYVLTIKKVLYVLLPISVLIIGFGRPLVQILFQRGAFSTHSTAATAGAWIAYTIGLPAQAVGILTARVYNALQENKTLMYVSGTSIVLNILFNWIFMNIWGHIGIALSTSGVYGCTTITLVYLLNKKIGTLQGRSRKEHRR